MLELLLNEIKAMQEKYERDVKILHDRIDLLVLEVERLKNG
jgi:hypothetical protein